jgi:hypothetical protein
VPTQQELKCVETLQGNVDTVACNQPLTAEQARKNKDIFRVKQKDIEKYIIDRLDIIFENIYKYEVQRLEKIVRDSSLEHKWSASVNVEIFEYSADVAAKIGIVDFLTDGSFSGLYKDVCIYFVNGMTNSTIYYVNWCIGKRRTPNNSVVSDDFTPQFSQIATRTKDKIRKYFLDLGYIVVNGCNDRCFHIKY